MNLLVASTKNSFSQLKDLPAHIQTKIQLNQLSSPLSVHTHIHVDREGENNLIISAKRETRLTVNIWTGSLQDRGEIE